MNQLNQSKLTLLQNFLVITLRESRLAPATITHNNQLVRKLRDDGAACDYIWSQWFGYPGLLSGRGHQEEPSTSGGRRGLRGLRAETGAAGALSAGGSDEAAAARDVVRRAATVTMGGLVSTAFESARDVVSTEAEERRRSECDDDRNDDENDARRAPSAEIPNARTPSGGTTTATSTGNGHCWPNNWGVSQVCFANSVGLCRMLKSLLEMDIRLEQCYY